MNKFSDCWKAPRSKYFDVEISGDLAMFGTPTSKQSCEMISYSMPTYSALCGMMRHIYYRPGITWVVEKCRIMNEVQYQYMTIKTPHYKQRYLKKKLLNPAIFEYTYLADVRYQLRAFYIIDNSFIQDTHGYCAFVHDDLIEKRIYFCPEKIVHLGKRNTGIAVVRPCSFGEKTGFYDSLGMSEPVYMFHDFKFDSNCWNRRITQIGYCKQYADNGIIDFQKIEVNYQDVKNHWEKIDVNSNGQ